MLRFSRSNLVTCALVAVATMAASTCWAVNDGPLVTGNLTYYFDMNEILVTDLVGAGATGRFAEESGNAYGAASTHEIGEIHEGDNLDVTPGTLTLGVGKRGAGAAEFNQSTDALDLPVYVTADGRHITNNFSANLPTSGLNGENGYTIAAWVNVEDNGGDQSVWQTRAAGGDFNTHFQLQGGGGALRATMRAAGACCTTVADSNDTAYPFDTWFHYAVTYDSDEDFDGAGGAGLGTMRKYLNGVEVATTPKAGTGANGGLVGDWGGQEALGDFFAAGFGAVEDSGGRRLEGFMDELYIYNRKLTAAEIYTVKAVGADVASSASTTTPDGLVDVNDFFVFSADFGNPSANGGTYDLTLDGNTDISDFFIFAEHFNGDPGPAGNGEALAEYNKDTGEIIVSANNVNSWKIDSASMALTGDDPMMLPAGGGTLSDSNSTIGEFTFPGNLTPYADVSLGNVAEPGLPMGDLTLSYIRQLGTQPVMVPVRVVPEPASLILLAMGVCGVLATRRPLAV